MALLSKYFGATRSGFILGLDVGTSTTKVVVAENSAGKPLVRLVSRFPSLGLKRGAVVDLAETSSIIGRALGEAKKISKYAPGNTYVNLGTHQTKCQSSKGIVAVSRADSEIYQDDVDRVVRASQAINLANNWMTVHHVPIEFVVDGIGDISSPIGLSGNRLEVNSLIVNAFSPHVKNLMRVVEVNGGQIGGLVLNPIAGSRAALSKQQKHLGTALIDLGGGTTSVIAYEDNKLLGAAVFPIGAINITNDIAVGLKIPVEAAEAMKVQYGYAVSREIGQREVVELKKLSPSLDGSVSRRFLSEIIEARLAEILDWVNNELRLITKAVYLPGGVVLSGGGAKLPGLTDLVGRQLKLSSQIGFGGGGEWEKYEPAFTEYFEDPEFVNVMGLVLSGVDKEGWHARSGNLLFNPKNFIRYFIP